MGVGAPGSRTWMLSRVVPLALLVALALGAPASVVLAQIDPQVRDRVVPAVVEIAIMLDATENGSTEAIYLPMGSGTIVSPDGLILTNWHVVDMAAHREQLNTWEAQAASDGESLTFVLDEDRLVILTTDGTSMPELAYLADVVAEHHALDLAVLRITGDEVGTPLLDPPALPFVPLGDSSGVRQGDPVDVFGYPMIGEESLIYTNGVVSGFSYEEGIEGPAWITTNATMSGGSSGGTALDRAGLLIGVPTQGTSLDCRPGDTNGDGTIDADDVGCIPTGGSLGQLRPINLARDLLAGAGLDSARIAEPVEPAVVPAESTATAVPATDPVPTLAAVEAPKDTDPAADTTPPGDTSYVFAEDYCRTGPVYPPGTQITLPRAVFPRSLPDSSVNGPGRVLSYFYLPYRPYLREPIPAGTVVEITGPYVENGVCDLWPVRYRMENGVPKEAYVDEWDLSPEFPNQVAPLPPERQFITRGMEAFCLSDPEITAGAVMVLAHDAPLFSYDRGYPFEFMQTIPAATEMEIRGPPVETGVCDMWRVTYVTTAPTPRPGPLTDEERMLGHSDQQVDGYIHESDLRLEGG